VCCLILLCFIISIQIAITIDQTTLTDARALIMDYVIWGIFTIDIIIRFIVCPNKLKYFIDPFNIIDIVSIMPNYIFMPIYYSTRSPSVLKYDRMVKCLIILKLFRCIPTMRILFVALSKSWRELGIRIKKTKFKILTILAKTFIFKFVFRHLLNLFTGWRFNLLWICLLC
jgi:hypothetical protein